MPAPNSTTVNWDTINSTTERTWLPGTEDNIFGTNAFYETLRSQGETKDGGEAIMQRILYGEGPAGWYTGTSPLDLSSADIITAARYNWRQCYAGVGIPWLEELKNGGKAQLASTIAEKLDVMEESMANQIGRGLYSDGSDIEQIFGLQIHVANTTSITVGGISASTNTWWRNVIVNMTGVPLSIYKMQQTAGLITKGKRRPNMIVTTQAIHDIFFALLQPSQRYTGTEGKTLTRVDFGSLPMIVDDHCPDGYLYMLNTNTFNFVSHSKDNMKLWGWMGPHDQMFKTNKLTWTGQLCCKNRRFNAVMYGITQ